MIRKISIGSDYKDAMHYTVGQNMRGQIIDCIIKKAPNLYLIYVRTPEGDVYCWKDVENMPVVVENDVEAFSRNSPL